MKTYSSLKSLLWEELYVGGRIICVILGVSAFTTLCYGIFLQKSGLNWQEIDLVCYILGYATTILLLLQISNSGEMFAGIPKRILSLPVSSSLIVTSSLLVRSIFIVAFTIISRIIVVMILIYFSHRYGISREQSFGYIDGFRHFFPLELRFHIPIVFPSMIHLIVYLTLQLVSWLFIFSPILVSALVLLTIVVAGLLPILGYGKIVAGILSFLTGFFFSSTSSGRWEMVRLSGVSVFSLLILFVYGFLIWFLSVKVVSKVRAEVKGDISSIFCLKYPEIIEKFPAKMFFERFPSSNIAQIWFEIKNSGLLIPIYTFIFFSLLSIFYLIVAILLWGMSSDLRFFYIYSPTVIVLTLPYVALILSGIVWYLRITRKLMRNLKEGVYQLCNLPITRKERVYAYWISGNLGLLVTLLFIWLIGFGYLYWLFKLHVFPQSMYLSIKEVVSELPFSNSASFLVPLLLASLSLTMFFGLVVWLVMFNPSSIILLSVLVFCLILPPRQIVNMLPPLFFLVRIIPSLVWVILFFAMYLCYTLMFFANLSIAIRARILEKKETLFVLSALILLFICIMPWHLLGNVNFLVLAGTYLFISTILASIWLKILLQAHGHRYVFGLKNFLRITEAHEVRVERPFYLIVGYILPLFFGLLVFISHLGIGVNQKCLAYFRENGLPTSLNELNERYHSIPDEENLSKRYFDLIPLARKVESEEFNYTQRYFEEASKVLTDDEEKECLRMFLKNYNQMFIEADTPLPKDAYTVCKELIEGPNSEFITELCRIAESGLERGHYPIDLTQGYSIDLPHLAMLRDATRKLGLKAVLCAIDEDYKNMLKALNASVFIYKSLENEPVIISQLVRVAIFGIIYENIQWILNHHELPEDILLRLDKVIQSCEVPREKRSLLNSAFHSELLTFLSYVLDPRYGGILSLNYYWDTTPAYLPLKDIVESWLPIMDVFFTRDIQQMVSVNLYTLLRKTATEVARKERVDIPQKLFLDFYTNRLFEISETDTIFLTTPPYWYYPSLLITYPSLNRMLDSELRLYIYMNLARTAIAIEKYRIRNSRLPENLEELVPHYLTAVPRDPYRNGETLIYVKGEDFSYKIYSVGMDREDDGGLERDHKRNIDKKRKDLTSGDYVFSVAPLSHRRTPNISQTVPFSKLCR